MLNKIIISGLAIAALGVGNYAITAPHSGAPQTAAIEYVAPAGTALASGTFSGRSDHITTGAVTLEKTAAGRYQLRFAADFTLDGAPDPIVALGNGETFDVANKIGALKTKTGAQTYQLPEGFTPGQFSQVYVWCEKFSVPLGVAEMANA